MSWLFSLFSRNQSKSSFYISSDFKKYLRKNNHLVGKPVYLSVERLCTIDVKTNSILSLNDLIKSQNNNKSDTILKAHVLKQNKAHDSFFDPNKSTNIQIEIKINGYVQYIPIFSSSKLEEENLEEETKLKQFYHNHEMALQYLKLIDLDKLQQEIKIEGFTVMNDDNNNENFLACIFNLGSCEKNLQIIQKYGFFKDFNKYKPKPNITFYCGLNLSYDRKTKEIDLRKNSFGFTPEHIAIYNLLTEINNFELDSGKFIS